MEGAGITSDFALAVGVYKVWLKLISPPETPVVRAGTLFIT